MNRHRWITINGCSLGASIGSLIWLADPKVMIVGLAILVPCLILNGISFWKVVFSNGGN